MLGAVQWFTDHTVWTHRFGILLFLLLYWIDLIALLCPHKLPFLVADGHPGQPVSFEGHVL